MLFPRGLLLVLTAFLLISCNETSTSRYGSGSSGASTVTESFTNDAQATFAEYGYSIPSPLLPDVMPCEPDTTYHNPLPNFPDPLPKGWLVYGNGDPLLVRHLVVFAHGNGHSVGGAYNPIDGEFKSGSWLGHMRTELFHANRMGLTGQVAFVATDYRDNFGFPALWGAQDTIAATLHALEKFPNVETVYLLGVSMGGAVSGTAIAEAHAMGIKKGPDKDQPLFDYWIDVEGVSQLAESWSEADAVSNVPGETGEFAARAAAGIERDAGGTPLECPSAFQRRSPALRAADLSAAGIRAVTVIHAADDGLVPYNQGREMATAAAASQLPTQFFTVLTTFFPVPGTSATGHVTGATGADAALAEALAQYNDPTGTGYVPPPTGDFSGHASEQYYVHPVMLTAFINLELMLAGTYREDVPYFECVVDDTYTTYSALAEFATAAYFTAVDLPSACQLDSVPAQ